MHSKQRSAAFYAFLNFSSKILRTKGLGHSSRIVNVRHVNVCKNFAQFKQIFSLLWNYPEHTVCWVWNNSRWMVKSGTDTWYLALDKFCQYRINRSNCYKIYTDSELIPCQNFASYSHSNLYDIVKWDPCFKNHCQKQATKKGDERFPITWISNTTELQRLKNSQIVFS